MQPAPPSQNDNKNDTEVFGAPFLSPAVGICIGIGIVDAAGDDDDLSMLEDVLPSYLV
jgi:hypothetical protein